MKPTLPGIPCGFYDLDAMTGGFQRSDLIIVAARPAMGKTAFCTNIAHHIAAGQQKLPVAVFSLEMSKEQLVQRILSSEAKIESNRLRSGRISQNEWEPISTAIGNLSELPLFIDDTPNITVKKYIESPPPPSRTRRNPRISLARLPAINGRYQRQPRARTISNYQKS